MRIPNTSLLALAIMFLMAWVAVLDGGLLSSSYTADSVRYMRMAENIKAGHFMNPNGLAGGEGWFAIWPIGYPVVLAAVSAVSGLDVYWASKAVSLLCAIAMLLIFWKFAKDAFPILALALVSRVNIGCSCCDEDFMIAPLRPDLIIDTVEK